MEEQKARNTTTPLKQNQQLQVPETCTSLHTNNIHRDVGRYNLKVMWSNQWRTLKEEN
jgi:hypothetical protein